MIWNRIDGNLKQMKGALREKWGKLTDDEFDRLAGERDKLVGVLQARYGCTRDEAEARVDHWANVYDTRH